MNTMRVVAFDLSLALGLVAANGAAQAQSGPAGSALPGTVGPGQSVSTAPTGSANTAAQPVPAATAPVAPAPLPPPTTAIPGQPYILVDPATGRQMPMLTYGPMLRQRPAELPYTEGAPIPRGYVLQEYHPRGLIIGGAVTFGVLYLISFSVASSNNFDSTNAWLAVPVIGPFGWLAARKSPTCNNTTSIYTVSCNTDDSGNRAMVAMDGMAQVAGAAMLIAGVAITRKRLLLTDQQELFVAPYTSSTGSGIRLFGRF